MGRGRGRGVRRPPPARGLPAADRPVHPRPGDRRRGNSFGGTLNSEVIVPAPLTSTRPAEPFSEAKARLAAAVEDARDEILELSHRIHANPEFAFEEHQAAGWVAEALKRHGFAVEHPAGRLATAIRTTRPGGRGGA